MSPVQRKITMPVWLAGSLFIAVFFSACSDRVKTDINVYKALDESLVNSNTAIQRGSEQVYHLLEEKLYDLSTSGRTKVWQPKAILIKTLSANMVTYIEELKLDLKKEAGLKSDEAAESFRVADKNAVIRLFNKQSKGKELYEKLQQYKVDILAVDREIGLEFEKTILFTNVTIDTTADKQQDFSKAFFDDIPTIAALALLSKFQNNIKITENKTITFCYNKIGSTDRFGFYRSYAAFAAISSGCVNAGEEIEITAGVAAFSKAALPTVIINNKNIPLDEIGAAKYKFKASEKSGKHIVPVKISFIDQEEKKQTITKNIEYTVAN